MATQEIADKMKAQTLRRLIREYDDIVGQLGNLIESKPARELHDMVEQGKKAAIVLRARRVYGELAWAFREELEETKDPVREEPYT